MDFVMSGRSPARTHYYRLLNPAGLSVRNNGQSAEAYNGANWAQYVFGAALPDAAGVWQTNMPAGLLPAGRYTMIGPFMQAGEAPAPTDEEVGRGADVDWTGTAIRIALDLLTAAGYTAPPSAAQVRDAIMACAVESGVTFEQAVRGIFGEAVGNLAVDTDTGEYVIKSADGTKERARAAIGSDGTRTITARDLS